MSRSIRHRKRESREALFLILLAIYEGELRLMFLKPGRSLGISGLRPFGSDPFGKCAQIVCHELGCLVPTLQHRDPEMIISLCWIDWHAHSIARYDSQEYGRLPRSSGLGVFEQRFHFAGRLR